MIESVSDCGKGLNADLSPEELGSGVWSAASNVRFNNGYAERFSGMSQIFDTTVPTPFWIAPYATTTTKYIVYAGTTSVYTDTGAARADITGTAPTGAVDDRWTGGTLNGVFIMNNGVDKPMYWAGAGTLATLTGWDANHKAAVIRPFKNFIIALNITKTAANYPHMVKWSDIAVPGAIPTAWTVTTANDAGENDLAETPDILVDCLPMGDVNIVYKERSMYAMSYIGAPYIFRFQRLPGNYGMLARGCAVDTPLGHVVMAAGDIVLHSGGQPQSIANGAIRRYIFRNMGSAYYKRSFVTSNPSKNEVWICFPSGESTTCDSAAVWNWADKTWAIRSLVNVNYGCTGLIAATDSWSSDSGTWDTDTTTWNESEYSPSESRLFLCHNASKISIADSGATDFGTTIAASLTRTGITLGDPMRVKTITGIRPRIDGVSGETLTIEVGASMYPDAEPTWGNPVTFTIGQSIKADCFATGRFLAVRFANTGYEQWRMRSFDIEYVNAGQF